MKFTLICLTLLSFSNLWAKVGQWELNDVSVLMPLPTEKDSRNFLLSAESTGRNGVLFPETHENSIKDLIISFERPEPDNIYQSIRVVGMRIDPCFKYTTIPFEKCHPQIRLVWQPTAGLNTKKVTTSDGAIHTFYDLTKEEFSGLTKDLMQLKIKNQKYGIYTTGAPLNIHPAFNRQERRHSFNEELKTIILNYAGEKSLTRFTFMRLLTKDLWWSFGGRDKDRNGIWHDTVIPKLSKGDITQDFFNEESHNPTGMRGTVLPDVIEKSDDLSEIVNGYSLKNDANGVEKLKKSFQKINRIENPNIHSPASLDCVHCHITDATKLWVEKEKPEMYKKVQTGLDVYTQDFISRHNLRNVTNKKAHNKSLRAFGHFESSPSVNQRVINESASVADFLNRQPNL
jgi:hypothetical protein